VRRLLLLALVLALAAGVFLPEEHGTASCIHWFGPHGSGVTCRAPLP
jgi:hypothetical protein